MLKLKNKGHIQFVKALLLIAVLVYILDHQFVLVCLRAGWTVCSVKEQYLKYENAGDELVGCTLTGIPPTSCDHGISPVYLKQTAENSKDIDKFASLVFSIKYSVLISSSHVLLATFILPCSTIFIFFIL